MEVAMHGDAPKTLHTIAYVSIPDSTDLEFLLWDLQDAIAAYARLSGTALPCPVDPQTAQANSPADGIVLAVEDELDNKSTAAIEQTLDRIGDTETRVYVVIQGDSGSPERARDAAENLRKACDLRELSWCGGVIAYAGSGVAALRHSPRMGLLRRPFSEAIDKLVGAIRMGCSIERAQHLGGGDAEDVDADGIVHAAPALPAPIWHAAMKHLVKRSNS